MKVTTIPSQVVFDFDKDIFDQIKRRFFFFLFSFLSQHDVQVFRMYLARYTSICHNSNIEKDALDRLRSLQLTYLTTYKVYKPNSGRLG